MKALDWLDYSYQALKLIVEGMKSDQRLENAIQDFGRQQPSFAAGLQTQMDGVTQHSNETCKEMLATIERQIREEQARLFRERDDDPSYAAAFEQKVNEVEAYLRSIRYSSNLDIW